MKGHRDLLVWQESIALVKDIYAATKTFPDDEKFGLTSQMRRAAVSLPSNIAEGAGRGSQREFAQFLVIARGSLSELETQLIIAKELNYLNETAKIEAKIQSIFRLLGGLLNNVKKKIAP
jgi:four helix bundle protein